jgi:hydrogenase maturation protein HypF
MIILSIKVHGYSGPGFALTSSASEVLRATGLHSRFTIRTINLADRIAVSDPVEVVEIRVRGRVQGVGFRPTVWRLAHELGLSGEVRNDAEGVLIRVAGGSGAITALLDRIQREPPPLARIERIERNHSAGTCAPGFHIVDSGAGTTRTQITPDAAICVECANEVLDPIERRHRYGFANCTRCGPRFSIIRGIPYDRAATTMAPFVLCDACRDEYRDPADRRFHAEAIACPACGPKTPSSIDEAAVLLRHGRIVAVKGLGGFQLACDATDADAVSRLRAAKHRETKPFALMARDLDVIRRYCAVSPDEARLLAGPEAPIMLLRATGDALPRAVAPGLRALGFMLPTTPLHLLLLRDSDHPVIMTSGNLTDEPQIIDDSEAIERFAGIADVVLTHDRAIATRIDDSVMRVMGGVPRVLRRARGFAPGAIPLPPGFAAAPDLLAAGGELKATFCLLKDGAAILSQHIGDLQDARTFDDYRRRIAHYFALFDHAPTAIAADLHPEYLSSKYARETGLKLIEVQHHHAHVAACLAENGRSIDAPPVLGIVLDGLGWGDDGTIWGGEFLLADYREARRLGSFKPVAMPGGAAAVREPWRNLYAHLRAAGLEPKQPHALLDAMIRDGLNAPMASSCGRLFDAMAAALGICAERQGHEGEAASRLEELVCEHTLRDEDDALAYPLVSSFPRTRESRGNTLTAAQGSRVRGNDELELPRIDPSPMWRAMLGDLNRRTHHTVIAARFHKGLAIAVVAMTRALAAQDRFDTVALSGGCFQNQVLFEQTERRLLDAGFTLLTHSLVPANDGGLALGQAVIAAARLIR